MRRQYLCIALIGLVPILFGCAARRISAPAKTIGDDVATFQGSLSATQDALEHEQADERSTITGTNRRCDFAIAATRQMQAEWMISSAKSGKDIFSTLQSQGSEEAIPLLTPPTPATLPPSVSFPVDKLGSLATTMNRLSKRQSTQAELNFLVNYGIAVNSQLSALEKQAKTKPQATPPAKPASPHK